MQRLFLQGNSPCLHFTAAKKPKTDISEDPEFVVNCVNNSRAISLTTVFLVAVVATVVDSITLPKLWFALPVFTLQLRRVALCGREEKRSQRTCTVSSANADFGELTPA